jgi:hypothetical protein
MKASWFKYSSTSPRIRKSYGRGYRNRDTCIGSSQSRYRAHNPFFNKPYIETGTPKPYPLNITITTGRISKSNPEVFVGIVWILPILNKNHRPLRIPLTRTASHCLAQIHISVDNEGIGDEIPMLWKPHGKLPTECHADQDLDEAKEKRDAYAQILAYHYTQQLLSFSSPQVTIPKGSNYELYFLFTFQESDFAYIISGLDFPKWSDGGQVFYHRTHGYMLAFPFQKEIKLRLRFPSLENPNGNEKTLMLRVESWDKVITNRI